MPRPRHAALPVRPSANGVRARRLGTTAATTLLLLVPAAAALGAAPTPAPVTADCATVAAGSTGPAVIALQRLLGVRADGGFGPVTASALRRWQSAHRLAPTGRVDAATWRALPGAATLCGTPIKTLVPPAKGPCRALRAGMSGLAVAALQQRLGVAPVGHFGPLTTAAVRAAQQRAGIAPPGPVGPRTWTALHLTGTPACPSATTGVEAESDTRPSPAPTPTTSAGPTTSPTAAPTEAPTASPSGSPTASPTPTAPSTSTPTPAPQPTPTPKPTSDPVLDARRAAIRAQVAATLKTLATSPTTTDDATAATAVRSALGVLGAKYVWGGSTPKGFDCSGLVMWSYAQAGVQVNRVAADQYAGGKRVPLAQARPGDVVFWASDVLDGRTIYHDAIYLGGGRIVEAPQRNAVVRIRSLSGSTLLPMVARPSTLLSLPLRPGAVGWTVRQVQRALLAGGASVTVDGGYAARTVTAVQAVQKAAGLPVTGVVDVATWNAITRNHV